MNKLFIDTTDNTKTKIELEANNKRKALIKEGSKASSQNVLLLIDQILKENSVSIKDLGEIWVNEGPGSYTGIKVGIAVANALSFSLSMPVNGKKNGELAQGKYK